MRLKKLKISGFKSFAEKVVIDFDSSIVAIVGPNGCGKSNIVDAFRWVMGEQSAKSMRGDKMHDVLFAGTETRKALNIAEVSVSLSDVEGFLATPFDEITITRRLHRSGESEYLLNKEQVRLKDIQDLLLGTGLGKNAFSIFEQGKLDQIINLNPNERRAIFDDAAGIGRFLQRKKETIRKLEQVTDNYNRLKDIHIEVEKQTRALKRQASQAASYNETKEQLEALEKKVLIFKWKSGAKKSGDFDETLQMTLKAIEEKNGQLLNLENELKKTKSQFSEQERVAKEKKEKLYQTQSTHKIHLADIEHQKQRLLEIKKREEHLLHEIEELGKVRKAEFTSAKEKERDLLKLGSEKKLAEMALSEKKEIKIHSENALLKVRENLKQLQKSHFDRAQKQNQIEKLQNQKQFQFESRKERAASLKLLLVEKKQLLKKLAKEIAAKEKSVADLILEIDRLKAEVDQFDDLLAINKAKREERQKEFDHLLQQIAEIQARETSLVRLRQEFEGFSSGAKELLKESKNPKSSIFEKLQPLFEYLSPSLGFEKALATVLYNYTQTLVLKDKEDLKLVLEFARKKKLQDFSLIVLESIDPKKRKITSHLLNHIESNSLATHLLDGVEIAETLEHGLDNIDREWVTHEGFFLDHHRVLFHIQSGQGERNTFLREAELKKIGENLQDLRKKRKDVETLIQSSAEERNELQEKRNALEEIRRRKEMDLVQENFTLQRALSDLEKGNHETAKLEKEESGLIASGVQDEEEIQLLSHSLETMQKEASDLNQKVGEHEREVSDLEKKFKLASDVWHESERFFHQIQSNWVALDQALKIFDAKDQEGQKQQRRALQELEEIKKATVETTELISIKEKDGITLHSELNILNDLTLNLEKKLDEEKSGCERLEENLSKERGLLGDLNERKHRLEISLAEDSALQREIESELLERYNLTIDALKKLEIQLDAGLEESEKEVRRLRQILERAGPVNLMAIEEYQAHEERFQELETQLRDLNESKEDLEQIISQLDSECRKIFESTFSQIRTNFLKNFSILFHGGEADLKFTDSMDVLEAGVEIVAKPPGKQMRSISLLSGGEKCLTALALLFSIFEVRPAPFCILDEVDAPLDDTNIDRFTNVLKQFIDKTQFIIVSHNKKTMSIADPLIGVSMEEKGVSKLLSLSFEKKQAITV